MTRDTSSPSDAAPSWPGVRIAAISLIGTLLLRLLHRTLRWERVGLDGEHKHWADGAPRILLFWHGRQLMMPWIYLDHRGPSGGRPINVLASQHRDGLLIRTILRYMGVKSVAGSSTRGGREALFALIRRLQEGEHIAVTPDGPKGPACKLKPGVLRIAQRSRALMYPTAYSAERYWQVKSWDRMILPKPFSRAVLIMDEPISVPEEISPAELDLIAQRTQVALEVVTRRADEFWTPGPRST